MIMHQSAEDYLERILMIKNETGSCISLDIAKSMGYSKASISRAVKNLKENGYITVLQNGEIELTKSGLEIANKMLERHQLLTSYFEKLGIPYDIASNDACKIEHDLSDITYNALIEHLKK